MHTLTIVCMINHNHGHHFIRFTSAGWILHYSSITMNKPYPMESEKLMLKVEMPFVQRLEISIVLD